MENLPTGTVTFLFTGIEDSTRLLVDVGSETYVECLEVHDAIVRDAITEHGGVVVKPEGGAYFAVFLTAPEAVAAAVVAQRGLQGHAWPEGAELQVRMGVHTGAGTIGGDDYVGIDVHRAARIASAAAGGQVLLSAATAAIVRPSLPEGVAIKDLGEHQLKDLDPEPLHQLLITGLVSEFPPLQAAGEIPTNLPVLPTSFVGRDEELAAVERLVGTARLVTLSGVAGAGKTRLALEVAAGVREDFPDGVWFVGLSTISDSDAIALEAASALGVRERQGVPVRDTLFEYLSVRRALLVVDNCEHVIGAAAEFINGLLLAAPDCSVIATSREVLRIGGEVAYRLSAMSLPEEASDLDLSEIASYDAVRLFVERAIAARPDFVMTTESAGAIADICKRLDGMPLAIELAAAQLRSSTPQEIAEHLDQRFQVLASGLRTDVPRQQTLAAAIDWSYQLLDEREQRLFERLSVFQNGFDLDAAQLVASGDDISRFEVLTIVSALVDKSLLIADVGGDVSRYRLLEMLRQFAADRLDATGDTDVFQRRHAQYFVAIAEAAESNLRGEQEREWRERIERELDNLRLAMEWAIDAGESELAMRLAGSIWRFWKVTFRFSAGVRWLDRAFRAGDDVDPIVRAKVMVGLGTLMSYTDSPADAGDMLGAAIEIYRELDAAGVDPVLLRHGYPSALLSLATNMWQYDQDFEGATGLWREALEAARRTGDDAGASTALGNLAEAAARSGDIEEARVGYAESIEASHALNSTHRTVEAIVLFAVFEMSIDEPARAIELLDEAIGLVQSADLPFWDDFALAMRAVAMHDLGEPEALERFVVSATKLFNNDEFLATYYYQLPLMLARADLECSSGNVERAALLLGALEELEDEHSRLEPIFEGTRRDRLVATLVSELGDERFAATVDQGRALSRNDVIDLTAGT